MAFMKAAVLHAQKEPLKLEDVPVPTLDMGRVLVKVKMCGICHTDISLMNDYPLRKKPPLILGHEVAGDIEQPNGCDGFQRGDRVMVRWTTACRDCYYCREGRESLCVRVKALGIDMDGGFAEFVSVPSDNVLKIPDKLTYEEAALATEAIGTPYKAIKRAKIEPGSNVAVFGIGGLGINAVSMVSGLRRGRVIAVDVYPEKLKNAMDYGASDAVNASETDAAQRIQELTEGRGVDVALEFVGRKDSMEQAVRCVRKGGRVVIVGATAVPFAVNPFRLFREEVEITGSYGSTKADSEEVLALMERGLMATKGIINSKCGLSEINGQVERLAKDRSIIRSVVIP